MSASGRKKLSCNISINDPVSSSSESELIEDEDLDLGVNFSGQLTFNETLGSEDGDDLDDGVEDEGQRSHGASFLSSSQAGLLTVSTVGSWESTSLERRKQARKFKLYDEPDLHQYEDSPPSLSSSKPSFSVTSAKTMKDGHKKFVLYTVAINRNIGSDTSQAIIEKRYSDFLHLHKQLSKTFPQIMENIYFPRKAFTGNFRLQFIAERSRAFEQYLTHIFTSEEIRLSTVYQDFFYAMDIRRAYKLMSENNFQEAIPLLQNASHLQAKLLGEEHPDTVVTFCALVVAYMSIEEGEAHALGYAESAFRIIREAQSSPFKIPLIQTLIGVRWRLNKEKRDLETLLATYVRPGIGPVDMPTLEDLVMQSLSHI
ncbi:Sorting nexin-21 [Holothuria leucospilota]|uniref:Sorting nexin-21 n=1 Tax=Holothuria leucospilota TaxID=206669 RepID=A0A9Q1CAW5_HOLLE|nr:Sorting nexin-21 [Holothuria leucospilota]